MNYGDWVIVFRICWIGLSSRFNIIVFVKPMYGRSPSKRGVGCQFGPDVTRRFLENNNLDYIIRSHEVKVINKLYKDYGTRKKLIIVKCWIFIHNIHYSSVNWKNLLNFRFSVDLLSILIFFIWLIFGLQGLGLFFSKIFL